MNKSALHWKSAFCPSSRQFDRRSREVRSLTCRCLQRCHSRQSYMLLPGPGDDLHSDRQTSTASFNLLRQPQYHVPRWLPISFFISSNTSKWNDACGITQKIIQSSIGSGSQQIATGAMGKGWQRTWRRKNQIEGTTRKLIQGLGKGLSIIDLRLDIVPVVDGSNGAGCLEMK